MAKSVSSKVKTIITNPRSGREKKIDTAIYAPMKAAIVESLKGSKGKTFTELSDDVVKIIRKKMPAFKGSIPWYTVSTLRDLETKGEVEWHMEKGRKLNKLAKKSKP
jgi:hypothetical protein